MAIETNADKFALLTLGHPCASLPFSPNYLGRGDRQTLLGGYPGVLWQSAESISFIDAMCVAVGEDGGTTPAMRTTSATLITLAVAFYSGAGGAATVAVDDSEGNTWEPGTIRETANGEESVQLFYCIGPSTSATHTFEATGVGGFITLAVEAFTATGEIEFVSESAGGVTNSGTSVQPGELTATEDGSLFVTGLNYSLRNTAVIDDDFTAQTLDWVDAVNVAGASAYKVQGTAGAENPTWSWDGAAEGAASMMLFQLAGEEVVQSHLMLLLGVGA